MKVKNNTKDVVFNEKKFKIIKLILLLIVIAIMVIATIKLYPFFKNLGTESGRMEFKEVIDNMGILGFFVIVLLVFVQLFLAFIPGEPLEIIAGMCHGTFLGMMAIFIGVFLGSTIIFFLVRKYGKNFIYTFFGKENVDKIEKSKLFKNEKKLDLIFFILFFIPGTPKDLFVYIGGLLPVKPLNFILISTFARFPSILSSTFLGSHLIEGDMVLSTIIFVGTFLISIIGILIWNKIQKNKKKENSL